MDVYDEEYFESRMSGVESLDLKGLLMGDAGAGELAEVLLRNDTVSWLDLQYNRIGPEGAKLLACALKYNDTVTDIHMNGNIIRSDGARAFAEAFRVNRSVVRIFGVHLQPEAVREFKLTEKFPYEPGNTSILRAIREKVDRVRLRYEFLVLKYLDDRERLQPLPCRLGHTERRVIQLAVTITDLPFHLIVSFLAVDTSGLYDALRIAKRVYLENEVA
eukprot:CAMPEP_0114471802 /NCGR_PEP_ID=MMETSP0104-20121206/12031_1 /TAXON_ID=37642 ORGANISM="Paraphysomonas imperforata, Strain PA2" /NCGR_SAMPLE_ID=MMETSP0104 /ASSEMBLY_ACC=CAM_ASM_000202 /LENGTH=217 /DNA_ID=CAMNT_0001645721 /DNA_START=217 /DNA_END=868 /DNA_ORIENTATION=+